MFASVGQLIRQAYIYAQVLAPEENLTQDGSQSTMLNIGLRLLNELIATNNMKGNNWSLVTTEQFAVSQNDDTLTLDGWSDIYQIRFLLGEVWYNISQEDLNKFLNGSVLNTSVGIPFIGFAQRTPTGYLFRFFQKASQPFTFEIWGYKQISFFTDPSNILNSENSFYANYYLYELAYRMQNYYQLPHTPYVLEQRWVLKKQLKDIKQTRTDVKMSYTSQAGSRGYLSVAALNLSQGYMP